MTELIWLLVQLDKGEPVRHTRDDFEDVVGYK